MESVFITIGGIEGAYYANHIVHSSLFTCLQREDISIIFEDLFLVVNL